MGLPEEETCKMRELIHMALRILSGHFKGWVAFTVPSCDADWFSVVL